MDSTRQASSFSLVISGAVVTVSYSREIGKKELGRWVESIVHKPRLDYEEEQHQARL